MKIELVTASEPNAPAIAGHHIHFINKQYVEMQQWYMKAFDATLRPGQTDFFIGADLPGVGYSLNFFRWEGDQSITHVPTAGRVVDHVGFEVKNLEAFCRALEAKGIKLTRPYTQKYAGDEQHRDGDDRRSLGRLDRADRGSRQTVKPCPERRTFIQALELQCFQRTRA